MFFTDLPSGQDNGGEPPLFSAGNNGGDNKATPLIIDTQTYKEQAELDESTNTSLKTTQATELVKPVCIKNGLNYSSIALSCPITVYKKESDYDFIEVAKIVDLNDRSMNPSKFSSVKYSIMQYPFSIRKALVEGTLKSHEWDVYKMEDLFFETYKNANLVYNRQYNTNITLK